MVPDSFPLTCWCPVLQVFHSGFHRLHSSHSVDKMIGSIGIFVIPRRASKNQAMRFKSYFRNQVITKNCTNHHHCRRRTPKRAPKTSETPLTTLLFLDSSETQRLSHVGLIGKRIPSKKIPQKHQTNIILSPPNTQTKTWDTKFTGTFAVLTCFNKKHILSSETTLPTLILK